MPPTEPASPASIPQKTKVTRRRKPDRKPTCLSCGSPEMVKYGIIKGKRPSQRYCCSVCSSTLLETRLERLATDVAIDRLVDIVKPETVAWFCDRVYARPRVFHPPARESLKEEAAAIDVLLDIAYKSTTDFDTIRAFQIPFIDRKRMYEHFIHRAAKKLPADYSRSTLKSIDVTEPPKVTSSGSEILAVVKPET